MFVTIANVNMRKLLNKLYYYIPLVINKYKSYSTVGEYHSCCCPISLLQRGNPMAQEAGTGEIHVDVIFKLLFFLIFFSIFWNFQNFSKFSTFFNIFNISKFCKFLSSYSKTHNPYPNKKNAKNYKVYHLSVYIKWHSLSSTPPPPII